MKKPSFTTVTTVLATAWFAHCAVDQEEGGMTDAEWRSWVRWTLGLASATTIAGTIGAYKVNGPRRAVNVFLAAAVGTPTFLVTAMNMIPSE
ncbi:MAG: hypothetical protein AAB459_03125 [Patescibacteria group bacterium]